MKCNKKYAIPIHSFVTNNLKSLHEIDEYFIIYWEFFTVTNKMSC